MASNEGKFVEVGRKSVNGGPFSFLRLDCVWSIGRWALVWLGCMGAKGPGIMEGESGDVSGRRFCILEKD